jgi:hypothetical protein
MAARIVRMPSSDVSQPDGQRAPGKQPGVPAGRYARQAPSRRVLIPLAATLAVVGVSAAAYAALVTSGRTTGKVVTFKTADDGVQITANIRRDPDRATECALRARNQAGAEVGRRIIVIPPGDGRKVTVSEFLSTSERPVTGEIMECRSKE